jgi:hypothetical protein
MNTGVRDASDASQTPGYVFFYVSFKFTNVYLNVDYEYRTRGLETRQNASRASLTGLRVRPPPPHQRTRTRTRTDRDGDEDTKGWGCGHERGPNDEVSSFGPGMFFFSCLFLTNGYLHVDIGLLATTTIHHCQHRARDASRARFLVFYHHQSLPLSLSLFDNTPKPGHNTHEKGSRRVKTRLELF